MFIMSHCIFHLFESKLTCVCHLFSKWLNADLSQMSEQLSSAIIVKLLAFKRAICLHAVRGQRLSQNLLAPRVYF